MLKKIIISVLIPALLIQVTGCYSEYLTAKENLHSELGDIRIVTNDKREYIGVERLWLVKNDTLIIYNNQLEKQYEIPYYSIDETYIDKIDGGKTAVLIAAVLLVVGALFYVGEKIISDSFRLNWK